MEGYSPQPGFADRLQALTGYPSDGFRAVRRHERLDIRHKRELYETIDALPLRAAHESLMGLSGLHTMQAAVDVFGEILTAGPNAVREAKWLTHYPLEGEETARLAARLRSSEEGREGLRAFLERRTPGWR